MTHENGPWTNQDGLLINQYTGVGVNAYEIAVVLDLDTGVVLKHGEESMCTEYLMIQRARMALLFPEDAQSIILVKFNEHQNLTPDEICTCINYMNNSIGPEKMKQLLQTESLDELKTKLQKFGELGF